jgi:hypothetical protein
MAKGGEFEVTVVNRYALRDAGAFESAIMAMVARVRDEGHRGVLAYCFYRAGPDEARAMVRYADPAAWVGHHDLIMGWPEMAAQRAAADLVEIELFGPMTAAMQDWIDRTGLGPKVRHRGEPFAGFQR